MPCTEASLTLPAELESVSRARHFLRDALSRWQADGYDLAAPQVLTELAANAALHARTTYTVHVRLEREVLLLEVSDSSATLPQHRHYGTAATTAVDRLVEALSQAWGVRLRGAGKTVWCRVGRDDRPRTSSTSTTTTSPWRARSPPPAGAGRAVRHGHGLRSMTGDHPEELITVHVVGLPVDLQAEARAAG